MTRTRNPYLEELSYQKAQQARYERGVRITGDTDPTYAHELRNTIATLEAKAEHWEYENALAKNNLNPILPPARVTDTIVPHMEDISEYEGVIAKLTVAYDTATSELHCGVFSALGGEELPKTTYSFHIFAGEEPEYSALTTAQTFTYQPELETSSMAANTAVFLPEISHPGAAKRIKILRPQGLYLLAARAQV